MVALRTFLGSLEALLGSDTELHDTCIPTSLSIHVNASKTSLSTYTVEFFEHSHLPYVSIPKHKTTQTLTK